MILISLGVLALAYQGIGYVMGHKLVDLGPTIVGGIALAAGIAVLAAGSGNREEG